ncbi:MAG: flippase [Candidatus Doudnabacteria bacterium]|nr:flippase [Candidatus Doudnabacteria bacterium]
MDHNEQAGKNFAWLSAAQLGTRILGAAFFIFLSRKLLETGVGEYSFVSSFVPFWFILVDFGGAAYLFREWTHGKKTAAEIKDDFHQLFTLRLLIVLAIGIPFLTVNYFINRQVLGSLVLFYISMYLAMFTNLLDLYFQSQNQYRYLAVRQVIEKTTAVAAGVVLLLIHPSVIMVFVAILISQLASIAYYYLATSPFGIKLVLRKEYAKKLFIKGMPFLFIGIFASLYAKIDVTMLRYMDNFQTVGYYGAAYKFMDFTALFSSLFISAIFPVLSPLWQGGKDSLAFNDFFQKCFRILFSAGLLVALFLIVAAPLLIKIFFPASFGPSVLALRILAIGQTLAFLSAIFSTMLIIEGREKIGLAIIIFGAVFNIVLNFILIPRFSLYGSAWATVIAEMGNLYLLQHFVSWKKPVNLLFKIVSVAGVNTVIFVFLKFTGLTNSLLAGTVILLTNAVILFTVKLLEKQDVALFVNPFLGKVKTLFGPLISNIF